MVTSVSSNFSNFGDTFVDNVNITNVTAVAGQTIVVFYFYRRTAPDTPAFTSLPSWNGENFTAIFSERQELGILEDVFAYLEAYILHPTTSGTFPINVGFGSEIYTVALAGYQVFSGVSPTSSIDLVNSEQQNVYQISSYSNPSLSVQNVDSNDLVLNILCGSYYNENFDNMTATTWSETQSQTPILNVSSSFTNMGRLYISNKTGVDTVSVGYAPSAGQPVYTHFALLVKGIADDPTQQLFLENTSQTFSVEQVVDTWEAGSAEGTLNGNWLNVYNEILPDGTLGVPFSFGIHDIQLRLVIEDETATRPQNYFPPSGFTAIEFSSVTSNLGENSIWNGLSSLVNGSQILVSNSQIADDTTPITVSWSANGTGTPSQNLNFVAFFVYFDTTSGELSLLSKAFISQDSGIISVNGGNPLEAGTPFNIVVSNINSNDIAFVYLEQGNYKWTLPITNIVNQTTITCVAPDPLPNSSVNVIRVLENKLARELRNFSPDSSANITWVPTPQTTNFLSVNRSGYLINTSGAPVTMTLPLEPEVGDTISYLDLAGTFNTNNFTINPNGNNFYGSPDNYVTTSNNESGLLFYSGTTYGWKFINVSPTI